MAKAKLNPNPEKGEEWLDFDQARWASKERRARRTNQGCRLLDHAARRLHAHASAPSADAIVHMGNQPEFGSPKRNEWKLNGPLQLTIGRLGFFPRGLLVLAVAVVVVVVVAEEEEEEDGGDIIDCLLLVGKGWSLWGWLAIAISLGWDSYLL